MMAEAVAMEYNQVDIQEKKQDTMWIHQFETIKTKCEKHIEDCMNKNVAAWDGTKQMFDYPKQWKVHTTRPNLTVYRRRSEFTQPPYPHAIAWRQFIACGQVPRQSIDDLIDGLYNETTQEEQITAAALYQNHYLDAAVIHVHENKTDDDLFHFIGIKSFVISSPVDALVSARRFVYFEYSKTVKTTDGKLLIFKIMMPIDHELLPQLNALAPDVHTRQLSFAGAVLGDICVTQMYHYDTRSHGVQVYAEGDIDPRGKATGWLGHVYLSHIVPLLLNVRDCSTAKYMTKRGLTISPKTPHLMTGEETPKSREIAAGVPTPTRKSISQSSMPHPDLSRIYAPSPKPSWNESSGENLTQRTGSDTSKSFWRHTDNFSSPIHTHPRIMCAVCLRTFKFLKRRRYYCEMCGDVCCRSCVQTIWFRALSKGGRVSESQHYHINAKSSPPVAPHQYCIPCLNRTSQERTGMSAIPLEEDRRIPMQPVIVGPYGLFDTDDGDEESDPEHDARIQKLRQQHIEADRRKNMPRKICLLDDDELVNVSSNNSSGPSVLPVPTSWEKSALQERHTEGNLKYEGEGYGKRMEDLLTELVSAPSPINVKEYPMREARGVSMSGADQIIQVQQALQRQKEMIELLKIDPTRKSEEVMKISKDSDQADHEHNENKGMGKTSDHTVVNRRNSAPIG